MKDANSIRILEQDSNRRGDLFGRLMADLFVALGYEQPRLNIHKSGREVDISANHRLESRRAVGECKATVEPIGGDELNKFVGALDAEQDEKRPVTGYFISLSGFKETAIEQESKRQTKIVILTGSQVVTELIMGRMLIEKERAADLAGRCCSGIQELLLDSQSELLAHERGWIWCVYYCQGKIKTHFALIHSDGTPLAWELSEEIICSDRECGGSLFRLKCLNPKPLQASDSDKQTMDAIAAYQRYIENECGNIQLDGLPADSDVGARRLRLENLFVPLHLDVAVRLNEVEQEIEYQPLGITLTEHPRLAILAAPGGGKSTLIKRLAVAYVAPERRGVVQDELPNKEWLPLFFRCRELRELARASFAQLLEALSFREPVRQHAVAFRAYVDRALLSGKILLLVDGLDEIYDVGDRAAFICTLRTSLQAYPGIAIVITSREAGFRHVAAHLASICSRATLSRFTNEDIYRLCVRWHQEVLGDTDKVRTDAMLLATNILKSERIRSLAENPLLLTTLLLVKRWVGTLPSRRAILYGKAVEVLLMTWNTEGHEPIPEEEALPQLCYVAAAMMFDEVQKISRPCLAALLKEARDCLPTELGYTKFTVDEFIHRVEDRSSLLMMTGHDIESGQLVEFFEFRHLTFQEYLTARAIVHGWHRGRKESDTLVSVLEPYMDKESWRQVFPLAAVLGGKNTEGLIQRLTENVTKMKDYFSLEVLPFLVLGSCLADEAAARPETIRSALRALIRMGRMLSKAPFTRTLAQGRYGSEFRAEAGKALINRSVDLPDASRAFLSSIRWQKWPDEGPKGFAQATERFLGLLHGHDVLGRCEAAVGLQDLCFKLYCKTLPSFFEGCEDNLLLCRLQLNKMIISGEDSEKYSSCWALMSLARLDFRNQIEPGILIALFNLWISTKDNYIRYMSAYAIASQKLIPRDSLDMGILQSSIEIKKILECYGKSGLWMDRPATLVIAWYSRMLNNSEISSRAGQLLSKAFPPVLSTLRVLIEQCGSTT